MKQKIEASKYTVLQPQDLWAFYSGYSAIYRGGGSISNSKLFKTNGYRPRDITVVYDPQHEIEMVIPDRTKGLSFASSITKLSKNPIISGSVWYLPKGTRLPEGLVFNVKEKEHPLLNAGIKMSVSEFSEKILVLSTKFISAHVRIEKGTGRIIEEFPGALAKAESR